MSSRCRHERVSCVECGITPEPHEVEILRRMGEFADFMAERRLTRFVLEDAKSNFRVEMERHSSAFAPKVDDTPAEVEDKDRCACGHSLGVEHTETGCFHGCNVAKCNESKVVTNG